MSTRGAPSASSSSRPTSAVNVRVGSAQNPTDAVSPLPDLATQLRRMRAALVLINAETTARNAARRVRRDAGERDVGADEALADVLDHDAFEAMLAALFPPARRGVGAGASSAVKVEPNGAGSSAAVKVEPNGAGSSAAVNAEPNNAAQVPSASNAADHSTVCTALPRAGRTNTSNGLASNTIAPKAPMVDSAHAGAIYRYELCSHKFEINPSTIPAALTTLARLRLPIPLSVLTPASLRALRSIARPKTVEVTTDFVRGTSYNVLDVSAFPDELSLTAMDFLQAYPNWLTIIESVADKEVTQGWCDHFQLMMEEEDFCGSFPSWYELDKLLRAQWISPKPAVPDVKDLAYLLALHSCQAEQGRPAMQGETLRGFYANKDNASDPVFLPSASEDDHAPGVQDNANSQNCSSYRRNRDFRYGPYHRADRNSQPREKPPRANSICVRCGAVGSHITNFCRAKYGRNSGLPIICDWVNGRFVRIGTDNEICINFNVRGWCEGYGASHPDHSCSFCGDAHAAHACTRICAL